MLANENGQNNDSPSEPRISPEPIESTSESSPQASPKPSTLRQIVPSDPNFEQTGKGQGNEEGCSSESNLEASPKPSTSREIRHRSPQPSTSRGIRHRSPQPSTSRSFLESSPEQSSPTPPRQEFFNTVPDGGIDLDLYNTPQTIFEDDQVAIIAQRVMFQHQIRYIYVTKLKATSCIVIVCLGLQPMMF